MNIEVSPLFSAKKEDTIPTELTFANIGTLKDALHVPPVKTDKDGRFRLSGLVPGMHYDLGLSKNDGYFIGRVPKDFCLDAGETKDLGEVKMTK